MLPSEMRKLTKGHKYWIGLPHGDYEKLFLIPAGIKGNTLQHYRRNGIETLDISRQEWEHLLKYFEFKMRTTSQSDRSKKNELIMSTLQQRN